MPKNYKGMFKSDHNAHANLPMYSMVKDYPSMDYSAYDGLNMYDNIAGIDQQIKKDSKKQKTGIGERSW